MDNPGFFAILPASVRYDRRLKPAEKIFYAEITSLADKTGCCYASNAYFCPLYDTTERTVQRWVKHLQELGYVAVSYARDGAANRRYISPLVGSVPDVCAENHPDKNVGERHPVSAGDKNVAPTPTKMSPTPDKNVTQNNTRITIQERTIRGRARERASGMFSGNPSRGMNG